MDGLDAGQVGTILDVDHQVICRTGLHCAPRVHEGIGTMEIDGTVRFSCGVFNKEQEIDKAIAAVQDVSAFRTEFVARRTAARSTPAEPAGAV